MSKGLIDQFDHLIPPTAEDKQNAISMGMIAVDTNVLLALYLYSPTARDHFISALANLRDRLWLSHQAAVEFHQNRALIIDAQNRSYSDILAALDGYRKETQKLESRVNEFSNRLGMTATERDRLAKLLTPDIDSAAQMIRDIQSSQEEFDPVQPDPILHRLDSIFAGRVGEAYAPEKYAEAASEAMRRVELRIPPGYLGSSKEEPPGDYLQWDQTLNEASLRKPSYLLLITADRKNDWWRRAHGRTLGPRPELALEARERAACRFIIVGPNEFLVLASTYSHTQVSNATLEEGERMADRVRELKKRFGQVND
ncbi:PIN-like domain-containing protein [Amycolatopsis sp. NPDC004747]